MALTVAIVGRPNVGKSTLFNRLVGRKLAIVDDTPGVTRDWRSAEASLHGLDLNVVDTAGLEEAGSDTLQSRMRRQTERALERADVALFLVDARSGITPLDRHFADWLRRGKTPVVLVANKAEGRSGEAGMLEAYELGLGEPVAISAEHNEGMSDLFDALLPFAAPEDEDEGAEREGEESGPIQMAILGRPNVGKSTFINAITGEERVLTSDEPGTTRDAISVDWTYRDRELRLIDTAGMRRRARVVDAVEKMSVGDTLHALRFAHVAVLMLDASQIFDSQDLAIARLILSEGRAIVVAVNKWDTVDDRGAALRRLNDRLEASLAQAKGVPTVTLSALKGQGLNQLLDAVLRAYEAWNRRVSTSRLNRWLLDAVASHPPPAVKGRPNRIRYMTQTKARPPTFAVWASHPDELPESYTRYLINGIRDTFDLPGVPIRVTYRKGRNPYASDDSER